MCQLTFAHFTVILAPMSSLNQPVSRRDFLKLAGLGLGALALRPLSSKLYLPENAGGLALPDFPQANLLGRNCSADTNMSGGMIFLKKRPDVNSDTLRNVYRDEVFPWVSEVSAETLNYALPNQRWVNVSEGYIWSPQLQPCRNQPNTPLTALPAGSAGCWMEVTVPYVDLILDNPKPISGWMRDHVAYDLMPRLYYSQVMWIDQIRSSDSGTIQYHVNERYGNPGDLFWAEGAAFRPLSEEDISPIHPEVDPATKEIHVNLNYQTLSCRENGREVYFCQVSTGAFEGSTPVGEHAIQQKVVSIRMAASSVWGRYDLPGISWTSLFTGDGVAIHAATSHNNFGAVQSHGCVNCKPEDAKWIFRWCQPAVPLEPGNVNWHDWKTGSTHVFVEDTF